MSLANLIRGKSENSEVVTVTVATSATQQQEGGRTVATVATVTVTSPEECKATAARIWLVRFSDRPPLQVLFVPEATREQAMASYPGAVSAEPLEESAGQSTPMPEKEAAAIRAWLASIGETDQATIAAVLERCASNLEARAYFLGRAEEPAIDPEAWEERAAIAEFDGGLSRPEADALAWLEDDRRKCRVCRNLQAGVCSIAAPGALVSARRGYSPLPDTLLRCAGYDPKEADPDQRKGIERWPNLT